MRENINYNELESNLVQIKTKFNGMFDFLEELKANISDSITSWEGNVPSDFFDSLKEYLISFDKELDDYYGIIEKCILNAIQNYRLADSNVSINK